MGTSKHNDENAVYISKKCPECYEYIPLDAKVCKSCKTKVGEIDKHGMAKRKTNWEANITAIVAWIIFFLYIWWAFIREKP